MGSVEAGVAGGGPAARAVARKRWRADSGELRVREGGGGWAKELEGAEGNPFRGLSWAEDCRSRELGGSFQKHS